MASYTAQILVGSPHQNHGGIVPSPIHQIFLSENSHPCWVMTGSGRCAAGNGKPVDQIRWIPESSQTILEDGLLFAALHVLRHEDLFAQAPSELTALDTPTVELSAINHDALERLRAACREYEFGGPGEHVLIFSVFEGSSLFAQLPALHQYKVACEVLTPKFSRLFSVWNGSTTTVGKLR